MEKEIKIQGEVDTSFGVGFFPVPVKLLVDENGKTLSWQWQDVTNSGRKVWRKPAATARVRVSKQEVLDQLRLNLT